MGLKTAGVLDCVQGLGAALPYRLGSDSYLMVADRSNTIAARCMRKQ